MMRAERADLLAHLKRRERVQKSAAKQRSAELLAEFEHNMAARYSFDDDAVWNEAALIAEREVEKARKRVAERCRELGIPKQFAPSPRFYWSERGENAIKERRSELRKAAQTRIAAIEKDALVQIERETLEAETELLKNGMTSDTARAFLENLTPIEQLMLSFDEIAGPADASLVEQVISLGALRQRRFWRREAQGR
jgi:hypothetical protein